MTRITAVLSSFGCVAVILSSRAPLSAQVPVIVDVTTIAGKPPSEVSTAHGEWKSLFDAIGSMA